MEVKQIQLNNMGLFSEVALPLAPTPENSSNVTVFIGNNGAGKTTVLKALVTSLSWFVARLRSETGKGSPILESEIKNGTNAAQIIIQLLDTEWLAEHSPEDVEDFTFSWALSRARKGKKGEFKTDLTKLHDLTEEVRGMYSQNPKVSLPLIAYYSVERVVLDIPLKIRGKHTFEQIDGYGNALTAGVDFRRFFEWYREREDSENESGISNEILESLTRAIEQIKDIDKENVIWKQLREFKASARDRQLTAVRTAVSTFMPGFSNLRIRRKPRLHMAIDKGEVTLNVAQLSQGEKSLMALVGDLARRLAMMNPSLENPLEGDGIVMIDEVDMHLHPKWQRSIISQFQKTFPNCQFVLTTHSPLVISDPKHLLCYELEDGEFRKVDNLYGMDVNQVLLQKMDAEICNSDIARKKDDLLESIHDGRIEEAKAKLTALEEELPADHLELNKARLLLQKLESRRARNR